MSLISHPSSQKPGNSGKSGTDPIPAAGETPENEWAHPASFLLDNLADAVISFDNDYNIRSWNKKAEEIYGASVTDVIGRPVSEVLFHEFMTDSREGAWKKLKKTGNWNGEVVHVGKDGKKLFMEISSTCMKDDRRQIIGYVSICRDITVRKDQEKKLEEEQVEKKREIIKAIMEAQEKERREISSELHDNVNQILTTCKLFLEIARNNPADARFIDVCYVNIQNVIQEIRNISHNLTPYTLKDLGLVATIRDIVEKINQSGKLLITLVSFQNLEEEKISPDIKLAIFRIIQEKISNVLKHSHATELKISVNLYDSRVYLQLSDNGQGFDEMLVKRGLGLNNIQNRVEYYKGSLHLKTAPGQGCELSIELPCT